MTPTTPNKLQLVAMLLALLLLAIVEVANSNYYLHIDTVPNNFNQ